MNRYRVVIAVVFPILILILIRSFGANNFKSDAKIQAEPSVLRSNIINAEQIGTLSGEKLFINLVENGNGINKLSGDTLNIPVDSLLEKKYLNTIRKHGGPLLLFSSDNAVSARIWMILSQMGIRNIFILTTDNENEVLKNKFRPDTIARPNFKHHSYRSLFCNIEIINISCGKWEP